MSGLASLLDSDLGRQIIGGISNETGTSEGKTSDLLSMALPLLTGAMKKKRIITARRRRTYECY